MSSLIELLLAAAVPIVGRVFAALGIGFVTYVGGSAVLDALLGLAKASFGGFRADALQIIAMSGVFQGLSIMAGAYVASFAVAALRRLSLAFPGTS